MEDEWPCPVHEEPLHLVPLSQRREVLREINKNRNKSKHILYHKSIGKFKGSIMKNFFRVWIGNLFKFYIF